MTHQLEKAKEMFTELIKSLAWHSLRLAMFRGSYKDMPDSKGLAVLLGATSATLGLMEMLLRGVDLTNAAMDSMRAMRASRKAGTAPTV